MRPIFRTRGQVGYRAVSSMTASPDRGGGSDSRAHVVAGDGEVVWSSSRIYSRTRIFAERFARALSGADHRPGGIYGAREDPQPVLTPR